MIEGSCLCGALRYEIEPPLRSMLHCHCSMCRKHHGSAFVTFVTAPPSAFRWTAPPQTLRRFRSSGLLERGFCDRCGSPAPVPLETAGLVLAPAGALHGELGVQPRAHLFVASKAPWDEINDALPRFEAFPQAGREGILRPAVPPKPGVTQGSCLCGTAAYELGGPPLRMAHCHCRRCRLARGAARATNIFYRLEQLRWVRGEAHARAYKLPGARFFGVAFCLDCGGKLPRACTERGVAIVPAGSLDDDPGQRPQQHIFVASKADWDVITDDLPQFSEGLPVP